MSYYAKITLSWTDDSVSAQDVADALTESSPKFADDPQGSLDLAHTVDRIQWPT